MPRQVSQSRPQLRAIIVPSIGNMVFLSVFFVLIFGSGNGLLGDGDTGYHIKTGEVILKSWKVPAYDFYSFHSPALSWTAHEWLSEVIMAMIFTWAGLTGVVVFFAFLLAFTHWLLYRSLRAKSNDLLLCTFLVLLATATSSIHWLARPHVFSILLTVVWCYCLDRYQSDNRTVFIGYLPFLMLLWVNLHGGFIIGLVLLGIHLANDFFNSLTAKPDASTVYSQRVKTLSLVFLACVAVCFVNPYGFNILLFPIRVTSDRFIMDRVIEFLSPNFHEALPFKYMLLFLIGALALSRAALSFADVACVTLLSYMSLYSARHVSLFAVILAPILLKVVSEIIARTPESFSAWYMNRNLYMRAIDSSLRPYLWPTVSIVLVTALVTTGLISFQFDNKKFPVKAVEFLRREKIPGNVFNDDEFGDYMIYAAWPMYRVFMDGRSDMYGERYGRDYLRIANVEPGWKQTMEKYGVGWVIFNTESPLTAALREQPDWQSIYSDPVATIFVKNEPEYRELLVKYSVVSVPTRYERLKAGDESAN
jgi:hypothetical protein